MEVWDDNNRITIVLLITELLEGYFSEDGRLIFKLDIYQVQELRNRLAEVCSYLD